jgi:hypothetical protein
LLYNTNRCLQSSETETPLICNEQTIIFVMLKRKLIWSIASYVQ